MIEILKIYGRFELSEGFGSIGIVQLGFTNSVYGPHAIRLLGLYV